MRKLLLACIPMALALVLSASGCAGMKAPGPAGEPTAARWKDYAVADFAQTHAFVGGGDNEALIFGGLPVATPAPGLAPDLAILLGRWEGFDLSPPIKKDLKGVLLIQDISEAGGRAFLWAGYNLQYPIWVKEIHFTVAREKSGPTIRWLGDLSGGPNGMAGMAGFSFAFDKESRTLKGGVNLAAGALSGPFELSRGRGFHVYKDYERYFAGLGFYPKKYLDPALSHYGQGYLVYLPPGYEARSEKKWPLILFLCGSGDRGSNIFLFAKNGPFQMVREKTHLPFVIVAPMLELSPEFRSFPNAYLDGIMAEIQAEYSLDPKRLYLTGLSMGGEASYRYALHARETFAAVAPLAAFDARFDPGFRKDGFKPFEALEAAKGQEIWAIHGADDTVVPLSAGRATAKEFEEAGAKITFTVLEGHDHDVWTDSYLDPGFYDWLLRFHRP